MVDKIKEYYVNVPVYTTENIANENGLFGSTYDNMITAAKERINNIITIPVGMLLVINVQK